ncbi:hypothetical protein VIGAN_10143900 [Vigna angularis var. angularis]|uniref:Uncharacterized protein n=1 Tax=Vigna angularis var. angularis TaxID=157739 RepID=A0A0S3T3T6_PHAAN|nr:hypothetical protein VIGAN_10143900 [Vigna angularis var. angularis]
MIQGGLQELGIRILRVKWSVGIERVESGNLRDATRETPIVVFDGATESLKVTGRVLHWCGDSNESLSEGKRMGIEIESEALLVFEE